MMERLEIIKSDSLKKEVDFIIEEENKEKIKKLAKRIKFMDEPFASVNELTDIETLPNPPAEY